MRRGCAFYSQSRRINSGQCQSDYIQHQLFRYALCWSALCRYALCRYALCSYALCRYALPDELEDGSVWLAFCTAAVPFVCLHPSHSCASARRIQRVMCFAFFIPGSAFFVAELATLGTHSIRSGGKCCPQGYLAKVDILRWLSSLQGFSPEPLRALSTVVGGVPLALIRNALMSAGLHDFSNVPHRCACIPAWQLQI